MSTIFAAVFVSQGQSPKFLPNQADIQAIFMNFHNN